jgi:succinate dehydrogenase / fumarate reductase, cytochrome b subunit
MMSNSKHPTSPHLQIYRLPLTALLSIIHRITGVILAVGSVMLVWVLAAAAYNADYYSAMIPHFGEWYGQVFLAGLVFSLYLHFCNGVRHLFWDVGYGFDLETVDLTAKLAILVAVGMTVATWVVSAVAAA